MEPLKIGKYEFSSRLITGTGKQVPYPLMRQCIDAAGAELVTVAMRRIPKNEPAGMTLLDNLTGLNLLPNTALCFTAKDAILTAQLAREALQTDLIKLEVIGDQDTLYPDNEELLIAARELIKDGFTLMPYCIDDPIVCRKLEDLGCAAVMPLAAPIGSGQGIRNTTNLQIIIEKANIPVIVDAGVGTASDAVIAMELGASAVLMQSAIFGAKKPVQMAQAMKLAIHSGYLAARAGRMPKKLYATASSPETGLVEAR